MPVSVYHHLRFAWKKVKTALGGQFQWKKGKFMWRPPRSLLSLWRSNKLSLKIAFSQHTPPSPKCPLLDLPNIVQRPSRCNWKDTEEISCFIGEVNCFYIPTRKVIVQNILHFPPKFFAHNLGFFKFSCCSMMMDDDFSPIVMITNVIKESRYNTQLHI